MIRLLLLDLDGTLTEDRNVTNLDIDAIESIRELQKTGIKVGLVSGNSYPVLRGLYTYLGLNGGLVAENGCIVFFKGEKHILCRKLEADIIQQFKITFGVKDTWQNEFRYCDFGFTPPKLTEEMAKWAKDRGLYIKSSGYAVHIAFEPAGKGIGVKKLIELHNIDRKEVAAIGDSSTDIELFNEVGLKIAVGNADDELKKIADYITSDKSGKGVKEFITKLLEGVRLR